MPYVIVIDFLLSSKYPICKENFETKFIGDLYTSHVVEAVPDFTPPESFNPSMIINLRSIVTL